MILAIFLILEILITSSNNNNSKIITLDLGEIITMVIIILEITIIISATIINFNSNSSSRILFNNKIITITKGNLRFQIIY